MVVPLKYLSYFGDLLICLEVTVRTCITSKMYKTPEVHANSVGSPPTDRVPPTLTTEVSLSTKNNVKFLENLKQGVKRMVSWNKYRSEVTKQPKNNNLDYMIDLTFRNFNRLFVFSFTNDVSDPTKLSFFS